MAKDDPTREPLGGWVHRKAEIQPERTALNVGRQQLSYTALAGRIDRFTQGLGRELGFEPGDRIAYLGRNHPDLLALLFAAARLGLIVVPLNWRLAQPELQAILADAAPKAVLAEKAFFADIEAIGGKTPPWRRIAQDFSGEGWLDLGGLLRDGGAVEIAGKASDPVLIVYTSGTTGRAKGAVLTQDAIRWNAANSVDMHHLTGADRILSALPLFHVGGLNIQTLPALSVGAEVRLEARFEPAEALRLIAETAPTLTVLVPAMMKALIDHPSFERADLSSLRLITTGSSLVPVPLIQAFHERDIPVVQVYGTTETAPIAVYQRAEDAVRTIGSAGRAGKHGAMRLIDENGLEVDAGSLGEIQIRGPQVMTGYWNNPLASDEAFDGSWFRTGDVGRLDEEGFLWVEARTDDLIKSGSERIYPAEIEAILCASDDVEEVVVVGKADPDWGEVPVAVVQLALGASIEPEQLLQRLEGKIARYKWPKEVRIVEALPRSALGKVLRYRLRAELVRN
ncbi:MAG: class I adenylate-forming enzyme family protein [Geminicoccaceae bacterium]